mmetsp:Transcript_27954/g.83776  ORF Transcript_27954/g.83776 Transcript_27954/m.83776 type:complete len:299 (+) Transcript_27954:472-1368(+)
MMLSRPPAAARLSLEGYGPREGRARRPELLERAALEPAAAAPARLELLGVQEGLFGDEGERLGARRLAELHHHEARQPRGQRDLRRVPHARPALLRGVLEDDPLALHVHEVRLLVRVQRPGHQVLVGPVRVVVVAVEGLDAPRELHVHLDRLRALHDVLGAPVDGRVGALGQAARVPVKAHDGLHDAVGRRRHVADRGAAAARIAAEPPRQQHLLAGVELRQLRPRQLAHPAVARLADGQDLLVPLLGRADAPDLGGARDDRDGDEAAPDGRRHEAAEDGARAARLLLLRFAHVLPHY